MIKIEGRNKRNMLKGRSRGKINKKANEEWGKEEKRKKIFSNEKITR